MFHPTQSEHHPSKPSHFNMSLPATSSDSSTIVGSDMDGDIQMMQSSYHHHTNEAHSQAHFHPYGDQATPMARHSLPIAVVAGGMMSSRGSAESLASSTSSTSLNREPELSQSFGSTRSYDLMTPIKPLQQLPSGSSNSNAKRRDSRQKENSGSGFTFGSKVGDHSGSPALAPRSRNNIGASNLTSSRHSIGLQTSLGLRRSSADTIDAPSSSAVTMLGLQLHESSDDKRTDSNSKESRTSAASPSKLQARAIPPGLAGRLKISLPPATVHDGPTTPGGHVATGARDGAAYSQTPLSPFEPPTPLLFPKDSSFFSGSTTPTVPLTPSSRPKMIQRHSSGKTHMLTGMSPLAKELSSLGMRKTMSSKGSDVSSSASSQRSSASECSSASTLVTPPFSPLIQSKTLPGELDLSLLTASQRSVSGGSSSSAVSTASSTASSSGKHGSSSNTSTRSSVSPRPKVAKVNNKVAPYPSPRDEFGATLSGTSSHKSGSVPMATSLSQPASSYFSTPKASARIDGSAETEAREDYDKTIRLAASSTASKSPLPAEMLAMPPMAPRMEKSKSEPVPQTVSARHLANKALHPVFARDYALGDELGSGGFGFVVGATRISDGMPVAVKFIWKDKVPSHGWVRDDRFGAIPMEAFVLKVIDSPFVVKFVDLFADHEFFYLVMEHHGTPWKAPSQEEESKPAMDTDLTPSAEHAKTPASSTQHLAPMDISAPLASPTFAVFPPGSDQPEQVALSSSPTAASDDGSSVISTESSISLRPIPMERRSSCDLFECIEQHSHFSEDRARWVFAQIVEAVYDLGRRGICHRDIKDENCVVDADFNVKLIDFGSAVITDPRKPTPYFNRFFGTMTFASSEILQGKQYRAPHAEVWSLGVLLSILLSGECPFSDPQAAIQGKISKPTKAFSEGASEVLLACLEVDPDRRATIRQIREHPWVSSAWAQRGRARPGSPASAN